MVALLQIFSPFVVTKIMVSLTFIAMPFSVVWFRRQVAGSDGATSAFLIGSAIAFNWFWLLGALNFMLGFSGFVFTLGLYWRWRNSMSLARSLTIAALLAFVFFSHLIGFLILTGSIVLVALFAKTETRKRTFIWTAPIVSTAIALLILYKIEISSGGEGFYPMWRSLTEPYALRSWLSQLIAVDPFVLISRKTLPFTNLDTPMLAVFSPIVWIVAALILFSLSTFLYREKVSEPERFPFVLLAAGSLILALLGPDDFNLSNGSLLRQRVFMAALIFLVPLFRFEKATTFIRAAQGCLLFVLTFQTVAIWEFALRSSADTRDFVTASSAISDEQRIASTVIVEDKPRFYASPLGQMNSYVGIGRNLIVVDNYEMGHNLFPLITRDPAMRKFIHDLTGSNVLYLKNPLEDFSTDLQNLDFNLSSNFGKIDVMLLYGRNDAVERVLSKTFDTQAFYESGRVRLYRRRN